MSDPVSGLPIGCHDFARSVRHEKIGVSAEQFRNETPCSALCCEIQADDPIVIELLNSIKSRTHEARS
jgi:hypothetical protein